MESFLGFVIQDNVLYWINFFQVLKEQAHFSGDFLDRSLVQFCFTNLLQVGSYSNNFIAVFSFDCVG